VVRSFKKPLSCSGSHRTGAVESGKQIAASEAETVANVMEEAASQLKETNLRTLAEYTSEIKATIKNFSDSLQPQRG